MMVQGISLQILSERLLIEQLVNAGDISRDDLMLVESEATAAGYVAHSQRAVEIARALISSQKCPEGRTSHEFSPSYFAQYGSSPSRIVIRTVADWFVIAKFDFGDMVRKLRAHLDGSIVRNSFNNLIVPTEVLDRLKLISDRPQLGTHLYSTAACHFAESVKKTLTEIPGMRQLDDGSLLWSFFTRSHEDFVVMDWLSIPGVSHLAETILFGVPKHLEVA